MGRTWRKPGRGSSANTAAAALPPCCPRVAQHLKYLQSTVHNSMTGTKDFVPFYFILQISFQVVCFGWVFPFSLFFQPLESLLCCLLFALKSLSCFLSSVLGLCRGQLWSKFTSGLANFRKEIDGRAQFRSFRKFPVIATLARLDKNSVKTVWRHAKHRGHARSRRLWAAGLRFFL